MATFKFELELIGKKLTAAYFWADNCPKCKVLGHSIESLMDSKGIVLMKIDVNVERDIALRYDILSLPTVIFFRGDQEELRLTSGKISMREIQKACEELLGG